MAATPPISPAFRAPAAPLEAEVEVVEEVALAEEAVLGVAVTVEAGGLAVDALSVPTDEVTARGGATGLLRAC
jgi:hypothetical protein